MEPRGLFEYIDEQYYKKYFFKKLSVTVIQSYL